LSWRPTGVQLSEKSPNDPRFNVITITNSMKKVNYMTMAIAAMRIKILNNDHNIIITRALNLNLKILKICHQLGDNLFYYYIAIMLFDNLLLDEFVSFVKINLTLFGSK